jgi:hypothetical protein
VDNNDDDVDDAKMLILVDDAADAEYDDAADYDGSYSSETSEVNSNVE